MVPSMSESNRRVIIDAKEKKKSKRGCFFFPRKIFGKKDGKGRPLMDVDEQRVFEISHGFFVAKRRVASVLLTTY